MHPPRGPVEVLRRFGGYYSTEDPAGSSSTATPSWGGQTLLNFLAVAGGVLGFNMEMPLVVRNINVKRRCDLGEDGEKKSKVISRDSSAKLWKRCDL